VAAAADGTGAAVEEEVEAVVVEGGTGTVAETAAAAEGEDGPRRARVVAAAEIGAAAIGADGGNISVISFVKRQRGLSKCCKNECENRNLI
jgi:hypothetical protein